jgi:hypothetical protein
LTAIKIDNFSGVSPRTSARLLPYNGAVTAANAKLLSGELRGLHASSLIHDFGATKTLRAYRLPATVDAPLVSGVQDFWVGFNSNEVDFVRTPVLQDQFERYYWTSDETRYNGAPQYNTRARIQNGDASFMLGVPAPVNALSVAPFAGTNFVRSYVYTFVTAYGEEGAPSISTLAEGNAGGWALTGFDITVPSASNYNITKINIYRTVADSTSTVAQYFYVDSVPLGTTSYLDGALDSKVAENYVLPSLTWLPPPVGLKGLMSHPGGFLCGFLDRDLYLSDPYHPHAWPIQNIFTCKTEIVGLSIYGNILVIGTSSNPYYADGMSPANLTLQKISSIDPCVSRRSMVASLGGVYYASPQGILVATAGATQLATQPILTRNEWQDQFSPSTIQAVGYGLQYVAFDTSATGFIFSPAEALAPLTTLDRYSAVDSIQVDQYNGEIYIVQNNQVRLFDPPAGVPIEYAWQSKDFDLPKPVSMGAMKIKFDGGSYQIPFALLADYTSFNAQRITMPLNSLNLAPINGVRTMAGITGPGAVLVQIKEPLGGSPLFSMGNLQGVINSVQVTISARESTGQVWVPQFIWTCVDERTYRLPAGYKADGWRVKLVANCNVFNIAIAETGAELKVA